MDTIDLAAIFRKHTGKHIPVDDLSYWTSEINMGLRPLSDFVDYIIASEAYRKRVWHLLRVEYRSKFFAEPDATVLEDLLSATRGRFADAADVAALMLVTCRRAP